MTGSTVPCPSGRCGWKMPGGQRMCGATSKYRTDAEETLNGEVCGIHRRRAAGLGYTTEPIRPAKEQTR